MAGRQGWGGAGWHAYIRSQPYDLGERSDFPDKDEIQVVLVPVTAETPNSFIMTPSYRKHPRLQATGADGRRRHDKG